MQYVQLTELKEMGPMFCPNCGKPVNEGTKFCTSCGAKLAVLPSPGSSSAPQQTLDDRKARLAEAANALADIKIGDIPAVVTQQAGVLKEKVAPELAAQIKKANDGAPSSVAGALAALYETLKAKSAQMALAAPADKPLYQPAPGKEATAKKTFIIGRVYQGLCIALVAAVAVAALTIISSPGLSQVGQAYYYANTLDSAFGTSYTSQLNSSMGKAIFRLLVYAAIAGFSIWVLHNGANKNFAGERCGCKLMWFFAIYSGVMLLLFILGGLAVGTSNFGAAAEVIGFSPWLLVLVVAAIFIVSTGVIWYRRRVYAEVGYISRG